MNTTLNELEISLNDIGAQGRAALVAALQVRQPQAYCDVVVVGLQFDIPGGVCLMWWCRQVNVGLTQYHGPGDDDSLVKARLVLNCVHAVKHSLITEINASDLGFDDNAAVQLAGALRFVAVSVTWRTAGVCMACV